MDNKQKLQKINKWQNCPYMAEIICPLDKGRIPLRGAVANGEVIFICPNCDFQAPIPDIILEDDILGQVVS